MKTNKRTATNRSIPRFSLDFEFDDIAFATESGQYHQLLTLLDNFKHYGSSGKYRKFSRPEERPTANPRGWWVFARIICFHLSHSQLIVCCLMYAKSVLVGQRNSSTQEENTERNTLSFIKR